MDKKKRMKNLLTIIFVGLLIVPLPFSCDTSSRGLSNFKIEELALTAGRWVQENRYYIEPMRFDPAPKDTLLSNEFGLAISIEKSTYTASANSTKSLLHSSALAKPAPPRSEADVSLISIYSPLPVFANKKTFDSADNLTALFTATASNDYNNEPESVLKFIEGFGKWYQEKSIYLILSTQLDRPLNQKLKVIVTLNDGTVFELKTEKVVVK